MSLPIAEIISTVPTAIQVCKDLKSLFNESRKGVESVSANDLWAVYINPIHHFKISWPTQRWSLLELGLHTAPYTYLPVTVGCRFVKPVRVPNILVTGTTNDVVPSVVITIDLNGGIEMAQYVKISLEGLKSAFDAAGGTFYEDRLGRTIESDNAIFAYHVVYSEATIWQIFRIRRVNDKMYTVCGTIIEGLSGIEVAICDIPKIMNSVCILANNNIKR
jgi:hypothetical protein